jgi:hypothetical protein
MHPRTAIAAIVVTILAGARALPAQTPAAAPAGIAANCTYATCALRVERGFLSQHLVRGAAGEQVGGNLGGFGGGMGPLLAGPDSAAAHARDYTRNMRTSGVLGVLGAVAFIVATVRTDNFRDTTDPDGVAIGASIASVGFAIASIPFSLRAQRDLSRAVWWYNAALPR